MTECVGTAISAVHLGNGPTTSCLLEPFVDAHRLIDHVGSVVRRYSDTPGMTLSAARMTAARVGPFEITGPVTAMISTASSGTFTVDGLLGAGFLRRFKVTFDFSRQQLWLEPNGRARGPQAFDASGIDVRPTGAHDFAIVAVAPDSPGDRAGLRVGDLLAEIDGRRASDLTLGEIQELLNQSGATCTIRVQRDGRVHTVTLRLVQRL